jgi:hypothetical protein
MTSTLGLGVTLGIAFVGTIGVWQASALMLVVSGFAL